MLKAPLTLIIDDGVPVINPLYYFAAQVPPGSVDYHYVYHDGKWYFAEDREFRHPIVQTIDDEFVDKLANWISSATVKGKISAIPYPAGLGRLDRDVKGMDRKQIEHFIAAYRKMLDKMDVTSEMLTHTNALDLKTYKLRDVSEHDWSQTQDTETLKEYISLSLNILKNAGLNPTGVTSPCNFGEKVEAKYAAAVLAAAKQELGLNVAWYFLKVDRESLYLRHEPVYLDTLGGEACVSIIAAYGDPFWSSQLTDLPRDEWLESAVSMILPKTGSSRFETMVENGSHIAIVTHWQSLYSNGTYFGLDGLKELVDRINSRFYDRVVWVKCSEIAQYVASATCAKFRILEGGIEVTSAFDCPNFTFSFKTPEPPKEILVNGRTLNQVDEKKALKANCWLWQEGRVFICLDRLQQTPNGGYSVRLVLH